MAPEADGDEDAHPPAAPNPYREGRRESAVIDASAEEAGDAVSRETELRAQEAAAEEEAPDAREPAPRPPPPPQRVLPWAALSLAVVGLLFAVGVGFHVFDTTDGAIVDLRAATASLQKSQAQLDQKSTGASDEAAAFAALERRVAALEDATKAASANLAALQSDTQKAVSLAEAPPPAPAQQVDLGPLEQRIADLEAKLQPLAASVAASKADVNASQDIVRKAVTSSDAAALVVVAQALVGALGRGAPFASEVAALQALGADPQQIAALQPVAAKGVPTAAALAQSFAPLAAPILTGASEKQPQGLLDRLERDASSLVRVRPFGAAAPEGTDPAALVARIEGALAEGDVVGAVAAWDQLPPPAKNVTGDWASAAAARVAADAAAQTLLTDATDRLGRAKP
jgi:hypothetical protein